MQKTVTRIEESDRVSCIISYDAFSSDALSDARKNFLAFQSDGVISPGQFEDDEWVMNNGIHQSRLRFAVDEGTYLAGAGTWTGCSLSVFIETVRTWTALQLGQISQEHLTGAVNELRRIAGASAASLEKMTVSTDASRILFFLPGGDDVRDSVLEELDFKRCASPERASSRRQLGDIDLYLSFGERMNDFWAKCSPAEKLRWFPIWLWFQVTFILPLRPTEFTLTPWDCIGGSQTEPTLTVCRTKLKKRKGTIAYRIEQDYERTVHYIPESLASEILWYRQHAVPGSKKEQLLGNGKWYGYTRFTKDLRDFCTECIDFPEGAEKILPGASRHLALIGIRASGADARVAVQAAGHSSFVQSLWYSSNLSDLAKGDILLFARSSGAVRPLSAPFRLVPEGRPVHRVPGGRCDAMEVLTGDIRECMSSLTADRHAGECPGCPHFYPDREAQFSMTERSAELNSADSAFLITMIEQLRAENGAKQTIDEMLDSMQTTSEKYLEALIRKENTRYGKEPVHTGGDSGQPDQ